MTEHEITTPTAAEMQADRRQQATALMATLADARARLPDPRSLVLSENERRQYDTILARFDGAIQGIRQALNGLEIPTARLAESTPHEKRMLVAKAVLEKQRDAAPDWRTVKDPRAREGAGARQEAMTAS